MWMFSGMRGRVVWNIFTSVVENPVASIMKVDE